MITRAFAQLTWPEVEQAIAAGAVALWPIGSTEAHGPHLPLDTDRIIAEETCRRAQAPIRDQLGIDALILPPLTFTVTEFAKPFAGTLTLPRETMLAFVRDAAREIARQGFRAVCLVNGHLEPGHRFMLRDAVRAASEGAPCPIGIADPADARFARTLTAELASGSCHAGQYETSLLLAAGDTVREAERARLAPLEIDLVKAIRGGAPSFREAGATLAYCGDPAAATRAEGESSYARLASIVTEVVAELLKEQP